MRLYALTLAACLRVAFTIYADEANTVDYHLPLLGFPVAKNTFFHQPHSDSKASLLYTLSEKSVAAAINPKDGSIVWRQVLSMNASAETSRLIPSSIPSTLFTTTEGLLSSWSASDGRQIWQREFPGGLVKDVTFTPHDQRGNPEADVFVLVEGARSGIWRLDGLSGAVKWAVEDSSGDTLYRLAVAGSKLYTVALHKALMKGCKIRVASFDLATGRQGDQYSLSSDSDVNSIEDVIYAAESDIPIVAWASTSQQTLKVNILGSKSVAALDAKRDSIQPDSLTIEAPRGHGGKPHFLLHVQAPSSHWADVLHVDTKKSTVSKAYELPRVEGHGAFSASQVEGNVYFTRITTEEVTLVSSTSADTLSRWWRKGIVAVVDQPAPRPAHATTEVVPKSATSYAVRSAVFYSSGDWALIRNGELIWQRCESLASVIGAEWAQLVGKPRIAQKELETESHANLISAYMHRVTRHAKELQAMALMVPEFPQMAQKWFETFLSSQQSSASKTKAFGFEKAIITVTENNRLIALDPTASGKIIWNFRIADFGVNEGLNATTVKSLNTAYTALLGGLSDRLNSLRVKGFIPPQRNQTSAAERSNWKSLSASYSLVGDTVQGKRNGVPTWTFLPKEGHKVTDIALPLSEEPVASIGKALGDRGVLYKYLNPNVIMVTASDEQRGEVSVSLIDAVSGSVYYTAEHKGVDVNRPISSVVSENWLAYSFTSDPSDPTLSKGYLLIIAELYESNLPNDRGPLRNAYNFSATGPSISAISQKPYVISQTFHLPEEISAMAVSQTTQGITSRQLLASLASSHAIVGIPRHVLDPRRPVGKDPTSDQIEEGLIRYQPMIDLDPKLYLNHRNEVFGVKKIVTSPSGMESTSLVFSYGLDIFGTRISPSFAFDILGTSFNKVQLGLTVIGLTIGVFVVAPLITRKQTNQLWHSN